MRVTWPGVPGQTVAMIFDLFLLVVGCTLLPVLNRLLSVISMLVRGYEMLRDRTLTYYSVGSLEWFGIFEWS